MLWRQRTSVSGQSLTKDKRFSLPARQFQRSRRVNQSPPFINHSVDCDERRASSAVVHDCREPPLIRDSRSKEAGQPGCRASINEMRPQKLTNLVCRDQIDTHVTFSLTLKNSQVISPTANMPLNSLPLFADKNLFRPHHVFSCRSLSG